MKRRSCPVSSPHRGRACNLTDPPEGLLHFNRVERRISLMLRHTLGITGHSIFILNSRKRALGVSHLPVGTPRMKSYRIWHLVLQGAACPIVSLTDFIQPFQIPSPEKVTPLGMNDPNTAQTFG